MSRDGWLPPGVSHLDIEYAAGWRPARTRKKSVDPDELCFACGRKLGKQAGKYRARIENEQTIIYIGRECAKKLVPEGWQPPQGGPRLFPLEKDPREKQNEHT